MKLSYTQISTYLTCPQRYYFRYIEGIKVPMNAAVVFGRAFHAALRQNYEQKVETREDLSVAQLRGAFDSAIAGLARGVTWGDDESPQALSDEGADLIERYMREIAPQIQPVLVEQRVEMTVAGIEFVAVLDLVDEQMRVIDHKTMSRAPAEDDVAKDLQLTTYAAAYRALFGSLPAGLVLQCAVRTKQPKFVSVTTVRTEAEINWWESLVESVDHAIRMGIWYPNPNGWHCSEKYCDYWRYCRGGLTDAVA